MMIFEIWCTRITHWLLLASSEQIPIQQAHDACADFWKMVTENDHYFLSLGTGHQAEAWDIWFCMAKLEMRGDSGRKKNSHWKTQSFPLEVLTFGFLWKIWNEWNSQQFCMFSKFEKSYLFKDTGHEISVMAIALTVMARSLPYVRCAGIWSGLARRDSRYQCSASTNLFILIYASPVMGGDRGHVEKSEVTEAHIPLFLCYITRSYNSQSSESDPRRIRLTVKFDRYLHSQLTFKC